MNFYKEIKGLEIKHTISTDVDKMVIVVTRDYDNDEFLNIVLSSDLKNNEIEILMGKKATAKFFFTRKEEDIQYNERLDILMEDNSRLEIISNSFAKKSKLNRCINQNKESKLIWRSILFGQDSFESITTNLLEEKSFADIRIIHGGLNFDKAVVYVKAIHNKPFTESNIETKGVLFNNASSFSRGTIEIKSEAINSKGHEKQDALLMDSNSKARILPILKINNNDVECSHGATIGRVDEKILFYLMSRGISKNEAKKIIINGFFSSVLDALPEDISKEIKEKVDLECNLI